LSIAIAPHESATAIDEPVSHRPDRDPTPRWLELWWSGLRSQPLSHVIHDPTATAVVAVDAIIGFCRSGKMATERLTAIVDPMTALFRDAHALGVQNFLLIQDKHHADDLEFASYAPHCVRGTWETDTVPELATLPFADEFTTIPKHSIHPSIGTHFSRWLTERPGLSTFIVVGAGTDLAVYQTAMDLRLRANALNTPGVRVVVPADAVASHHRSILQAKVEDKAPHPDDYFHRIFLYHMALNGIDVVSSLRGEH
jgi:nicotinamidase-related amidase